MAARGSNALFRVDAAGRSTPLAHVWEHTVGSGRALLALRADWQAQLRRAREEIGFRRVRFHGLLSDEIGTLVEQKGALLYSFHNVDVVYDALLDMDVRPFVELSFMPTAIASGEKTVFRYRGNVTPPNDLEAWSALVRRLCSHCLERYGKSEVRGWYFEVWNEPNLPDFWDGTRSDYFTLYRDTARTIKELDPDLRVGGPATAKNEWLTEFLDYCGRHDVPVDFVTTHHYPTDDFDDPEDDTETQLARATRGALRQQAAQSRRQVGDKPLFYTEWNSSSNSRDPLHDTPYAAAFVGKTVLEAAEIVQGYSFWTFTDVFDETYFPSLPFHGGFGLLNLHGIPKPAYRALEALHGVGEERLEVTGTHATVDAWAVRRNRDLTLVLTNHTLPRHPIGNEEVRLEIVGAAPFARAHVRRIDEENANAPAAWRAMGAPEYPSRKQVEELMDASRLRRDPLPVEGIEGTLHVTLDLPAHAVAILTIEDACPPGGSSAARVGGP
jgi:xylan 1,4-beta-xylosidase